MLKYHYNNATVYCFLRNSRVVVYIRYKSYASLVSNCQQLLKMFATCTSPQPLKIGSPYSCSHRLWRLFTDISYIEIQNYRQLAIMKDTCKNYYKLLPCYCKNINLIDQRCNEVNICSTCLSHC